MDLTQHTTGPRPTVPYWAAASLLGGAGAIAWWASGINANRGPDHMIGPYQVPLTLEYVVGATAVALGLAALRAWTKPTRARGAVTRSTTVVLVLTAMTTAGLWRAMTVGGVGANIGGGMAAFAGPILIAALLFTAVCVQRATGRMRTRTFVGLSLLTLGTGPLLFAVVWFGLAP